jgi:NAD(P)-dependent dehydrogenase (short-subunit alcohol dehydrogenase family)
MKIAITGHSRGLGAEFKKIYESKGHTVIGFSRTNGYDLRDWSKMQSMIDQIQEYDIFVSCAKPDFVQTTILYELWKKWKGQDKLIINISSILTYFPTCPSNLFSDTQMDLYRTSKLSLNEATAQLTFKHNLPSILLVKPSHLYDNPISADQEKNLNKWVTTLLTLIDCAKENNLNLKEITL